MGCANSREDAFSCSVCCSATCCRCCGTIQNVQCARCKGSFAAWTCRLILQIVFFWPIFLVLFSCLAPFVLLPLFLISLCCSKCSCLNACSKVSQLRRFLCRGLLCSCPLVSKELESLYDSVAAIEGLREEFDRDMEASRRRFSRDLLERVDIATSVPKRVASIQTDAQERLRLLRDGTMTFTRSGDYQRVQTGLRNIRRDSARTLDELEMFLQSRQGPLAGDLDDYVPVHNSERDPFLINSTDRDQSSSSSLTSSEHRHPRPSPYAPYTTLLRNRLEAVTRHVNSSSSEFEEFRTTAFEEREARFERAVDQASTLVELDQDVSRLAQMFEEEKSSFPEEKEEIGNKLQRLGSKTAFSDVSECFDCIKSLQVQAASVDELLQRSSEEMLPTEEHYDEIGTKIREFDEVTEDLDLGPSKQFIRSGTMSLGSTVNKLRENGKKILRGVSFHRNRLQVYCNENVQSLIGQFEEHQEEARRLGATVEEEMETMSHELSAQEVLDMAEKRMQEIKQTYVISLEEVETVAKEVFRNLQEWCRTVAQKGAAGRLLRGRLPGRTYTHSMHLWQRIRDSEWPGFSAFDNGMNKVIAAFGSLLGQIKNSLQRERRLWQEQFAFEMTEEEEITNAHEMLQSRVEDGQQRRSVMWWCERIEVLREVGQMNTESLDRRVKKLPSDEQLEDLTGIMQRWHHAQTLANRLLNENRFARLRSGVETEVQAEEKTYNATLRLTELLREDHEFNSVNSDLYTNPSLGDHLRQLTSLSSRCEVLLTELKDFCPQVTLDDVDESLEEVSSRFFDEWKRLEVSIEEKWGNLCLFVVEELSQREELVEDETLSKRMVQLSYRILAELTLNKDDTPLLIIETGLNQMVACVSQLVQRLFDPLLAQFRELSVRRELVQTKLQAGNSPSINELSSKFDGIQNGSVSFCLSVLELSKKAISECSQVLNSAFDVAPKSEEFAVVEDILEQTRRLRDIVHSRLSTTSFARLRATADEFVDVREMEYRGFRAEVEALALNLGFTVLCEDNFGSSGVAQVLSTFNECNARVYRIAIEYDGFWEERMNDETPSRSFSNVDEWIVAVTDLFVRPIAEIEGEKTGMWIGLKAKMETATQQLSRQTVTGCSALLLEQLKKVGGAIVNCPTREFQVAKDCGFGVFEDGPRLLIGVCKINEDGLPCLHGRGIELYEQARCLFVGTYLHREKGSGALVPVNEPSLVASSSGTSGDNVSEDSSQMMNVRAYRAGRGIEIQDGNVYDGEWMGNLSSLRYFHMNEDFGEVRHVSNSSAERKTNPTEVGITELTGTMVLLCPSQANAGNRTLRLMQAHHYNLIPKRQRLIQIHGCVSDPTSRYADWLVCEILDRNLLHAYISVIEDATEANMTRVNQFLRPFAEDIDMDSEAAVVKFIVDVLKPVDGWLGTYRTNDSDTLGILTICVREALVRINVRKALADHLDKIATVTHSLHGTDQLGSGSGTVAVQEAVQKFKAMEKEKEELSGLEQLARERWNGMLEEAEKTCGSFPGMSRRGQDELRRLGSAIRSRINSRGPLMNALETVLDSILPYLMGLLGSSDDITKAFQAEAENLRYQTSNWAIKQSCSKLNSIGVVFRSNLREMRDYFGRFNRANQNLSRVAGWSIQFVDEYGLLNSLDDVASRFESAVSDMQRAINQVEYYWSPSSSQYSRPLVTRKELLRMTRLEVAVITLARCVGQLMQGREARCAVSTFSTSYRLLFGFQRDPERSVNGIIQILERGAEGSTRLFDSMIDFARYLQRDRRPNVPCVLICLTDGEDTTRKSVSSAAAGLRSFGQGAINFLFLLGVGISGAYQQNMKSLMEQAAGTYLEVKDFSVLSTVMTLLMVQIQRQIRVAAATVQVEQAEVTVVGVGARNVVTMDKPVDIGIILDVSGSMKEYVSRDESRL